MGRNSQCITDIRFVPEHFNPRCDCTIPEAWEVLVGRQVVAWGDNRKEALNRALGDGFMLPRRFPDF